MFRAKTTILTAALIAAFVLLVWGCGDDTSKPTSTSATSSSPSGTLPAAPSGEPAASGAPSALPATSSSSDPTAAAGGASDTPPTVSGSAPPPPPPPPPAGTTLPPPVVPPPPVQPPPPPVEVKVDPAKPGTADEIAEKVDKIYQPIKRFRARFDQKYVAKVAGTTKKSSGVVYVERPDKLSFTYHEPNKNRVVSDGSTIKIYEHENQQMFVKSVQNTEYPGAFAFIMGKGLRTNFTFKFNETVQWEGGPVLIGKPRSPNPGYKAVLFYIDESRLKSGDPQCVRRVLVIDAQSNRNRFDFLDISQPAKIKASEFKFNPPKGTQIIK